MKTTVFIVVCAVAFSFAARLHAEIPPSTQAVGAGRAPEKRSDGDLFSFYATNLRGSLFSGFLTLGSFLVAVNTFIVVNLKKEVYDHAKYRLKVVAAKQGDSSASFYGALRRLSGLIFITVLLSLGAAVSQLTVGVFFKNWISAVFCLSVAFLAIASLVFSLFQIRLNLRDWFDFLEETAEAEYQKSLKEQSSNGHQASSAATPDT